MKILSLAICSLGVWVVLNALVEAIWDDIVFGAIAAVLAVINALKPNVLDNIAIGTTKWIINDKTSDIKGLVSKIADVPLFASDLDFSGSRFYGLKAYEAGVVKEGVGCGGATIAAILKSNGKITKQIMLKEIENSYRQLVGET